MTVVVTAHRHLHGADTATWHKETGKTGDNPYGAGSPYKADSPNNTYGRGISIYADDDGRSMEITAKTGLSACDITGTLNSYILLSHLRLPLTRWSGSDLPG